MSEEYPFKYNNMMIMKSGIVRSDIVIDLPSLVSLTGSGNNLMYFGSVILESIRDSLLLTRHSFTVI